jgi:hypothetical protein
MQEQENTQRYKVIKFFRVSGRREILRRGLTRDEAMRVVNQYPDSTRSLVGFELQTNNR